MKTKLLILALIMAGLVTPVCYSGTTGPRGGPQAKQESAQQPSITQKIWQLWTNLKWPSVSSKKTTTTPGQQFRFLSKTRHEFRYTPPSVPDSELGIHKISKIGEWRAAFPPTEMTNGNITQRAGRGNIFSTSGEFNEADIKKVLREINKE